MTSEAQETILTEAEILEEALQGLSDMQKAYVRAWCAGAGTRVEAYRKGFGKTGPVTAGNRSCAAQLHAKPKIQRAIQAFSARENAKSLLTRHEKRLFLAQVVRAHLPGQRAVDPNSPFLKMDPLVAVKIDNEMSGDNAPREITGELTLGAILMDLTGPALVDGSRRQGRALPIPAAAGGYGELPPAPVNGRIVLEASRINQDGFGEVSADQEMPAALEAFRIDPEALARFGSKGNGIYGPAGGQDLELEPDLEHSNQDGSGSATRRRKETDRPFDI